MAASGGGFLILLFAVVFFVQTKDGIIRVEINDPQIEVAIKGTKILLKQADNGKDVKVTAGDKTLVIERGDFKFETDKLVLKKDDTVTVQVTLLTGNVEVKQGDTVIGRGKLPAAWHGWAADAPKPAVAPFNAVQAKKHQLAWAAYLKLPLEYENALGMRFVLIPPGEFTMGSTAAEIEEALKAAGEDKRWQEYVKSEAPQHKVILTQPIYLGVNEVTQQQYKEVMGKNPSNFAKTGPEPQSVEKVAGADTTQHPVERVSWIDAAEFCAKLSQKEELKPFYFRAGDTITPLDGTGYRLPTEAEWEFSCLAGTTTHYWIGDRDEDLVRAGWFGTNSGGRTHAVGESKANPLGLFDIHGNVWEWVQDRWEPAYYGQFAEKAAIDPTGPSSAGSRRVRRGGSWDAAASGCRSSFRFASGPEYSFGNIGFRVSLLIDAVREPAAGTAGQHGWQNDEERAAAK